jgi:hypothetical protein
MPTPPREEGANPAQGEVYGEAFGESSPDWKGTLGYGYLFTIILAIGFILFVVKLALLLS